MYELYGRDGKRIAHHDLQDKSPWCSHGASKELVFVKGFGSQLGLILNPEKVRNKYAPDLWNTRTLKRGDLKVQNTPFFQAMTRFGINPQHAVVFNHKDRVRYQEKYPDIEVYFWVDWVALRFVSGGRSISVEPMSGVWFIPFPKLDAILQGAPLHGYLQRVDDDKGNAKSSYVVDITRPDFKRVV
jgi:hypothetical protein